MLDEQTPNTPNGVDTLNSELEGYPLAKVIQNVGKIMENGKKLLDASREADKTIMPKPLNSEDRSAAVEAARGVSEQLGGKEELIAWDKNITPEQKALLRGLNYHEYPTIQELSAANILQNVEKTMDNGKRLLRAEKDRVKQYLKICFLFH